MNETSFPRRACWVLLFALAAAALPAGNVVVPALDLLTHGVINGNALELSSRGKVDLEVEGGYKFGGRIALRYEDSSIEEVSSTDGLSLEGLSFTVHQPAGIPLDLSWFIGEADTFCSGDAFPARFGTAPIASAYRGYLYFPTGILYDGIHTVKGTGLRVDVTAIKERLILSGWLYQDSWFTDGALPFPALLPGHWAADVRALASFTFAQLEGFLGFTTAGLAAGWFRGGLLFHAASPTIEILAAVGVPKWDPVFDPFSLNLVSLLFEPRLHLGSFSMTPTFFWHPAWYRQELTGELGSFDVNLNLCLGDLSKHVVQGGLEGNVRFSSTTGVIDLKASPFVRFATAGALWDVKVSARVWPFDLADLLEGFVGIRAEF